MKEPSEGFWFSITSYYPFMPLSDLKILQAVEGTTLFYPHSARDFLLPVELFAPYVKDFWFADWGYFGADDPADTAGSLFGVVNGLKFLGAEVTGPPVAIMEQQPHRFLVPCVRSESYQHIRSGQVIRIHRRRGFSTPTFHQLKSIGVFFYRRDSSEGSSTAWLAAPNYSPNKRQRWLVHEVVDKLVNKGLIVTDGSRCDGEHNPYKGFRQFRLNNIIGPEAVREAEPFEDDEGRRFECVGYAGRGNGPVLIWQVSKP